MLILLILILMIILFAVKGYDIVRCVLMKWGDMSEDEAADTIHDFVQKNAEKMNGTANSFASNLEPHIWNKVKIVVSEQRFNQLQELYRSEVQPPLYYPYIDLGLSSVAISLYYDNDNEKQQLETLIREKLKDHLVANSYDKRMIVEWVMRYDLNMPVLILRFATNRKQRRTLDNILALNCDKIIARNSDVIDDTEDDDLRG